MTNNYSQGHITPNVSPDTVGNGIGVIPSNGPVTLRGRCKLWQGDRYRLLVFSSGDYSKCYARETFNREFFEINSLPVDSVDIVCFAPGHIPAKCSNVYLSADYGRLIEIELPFLPDRDDWLLDEIPIIFKRQIVQWPNNLGGYIPLNEFCLPDNMRIFLSLYGFVALKKAFPWVLPGGFTFSGEKRLTDSQSRKYYGKLKERPTRGFLLFVLNSVNLHQSIEAVPYSFPPTYY